MAKPGSEPCYIVGAILVIARVGLVGGELVWGKYKIRPLGDYGDEYKIRPYEY